METIDFNSCKGKETLFREHKEFRLGTKKLDNKKCRDYCETNKYEFNDIIYDNLMEYIEYYIPKYYTAFMNSHINGNLFLGLDDYGFVRGIPFQGELPFDKLEEIIFNSLYDNITYSGSNDFYKTIKIKWIKVENIPKPVQPIIPEYTYYLEQKQKYDDAYNKWYEMMTDHEIRFAYYSRKLVALGNDMECRKLIIDSIKNVDPINKIIKFFESDRMLEPKDSEEILRMKEDPNEPEYWVMKWKDEIISKIRSEKPQFSYDFHQYNAPLNLITNAGSMIPYWKRDNLDINVYILQITFVPEESAHYDFSYLESKCRNIWMKSYRILDEKDNSPSTRSYKVLV